MKNSKNNTAEIRRALKETSKYILSHHLPKEYQKCHSFGKIKVCSRCLGIYLGILIGAFTYDSVFNNHFTVALLPVFTFTDWILTEFFGFKSSNNIRSGSGILLGIAYAFGIALFLRNFPDLTILSIGLAYGLAAIALILWKAKD